LQHSWEILRNNVQNYIKGINFGYKMKLKEIEVDFVDAKGIFKDQNTVEFNYPKSSKDKTFQL